MKYIGEIGSDRILLWGCCDRDRMVGAFLITYAISDFHY
jgi:hypothetical protein